MARVLAVSIPDLPSADRAVREARRLNERLDIIARAPGGSGPDRLRVSGAIEVVRPEFEAGLEFVRHTLHRYGVPRTEVQAIVGRRRAEYYGALGRVGERTSTATSRRRGSGDDDAARG